MAGHIHLAIDGPVARVTLDHGGKFNAMSRSMWKTLQTIFLELQTNAAVRCVVVQGAAGHFCAGGDISEYPSFRFDEAQLQQFHEQEVWGALQAMLDCDIPILAQIEGNCMGAGVEIASCCDLRIAKDSSRFGAPIARLGFPMAPKEAALVSQAVGETTARAMLLAAEVFDAAHMHNCGFLTHCIAGEAWLTHCEAMVKRVIQLGPQSARLNQQTLRSLPLSPYSYANSAEHREGIDAFLQKRNPLF
jgi:enoyl-CoA hydratase/carnithine racemase